MSDFIDILKRGKKVFNTKNSIGVYGRCEECNARAVLYKYQDEEGQIWLLCEQCISTFAKDEVDE
jgi:hypothetical protein